MRQITLNIPETQEDCDDMESCNVCSYYNQCDSFECESFLEGLDEGV